MPEVGVANASPVIVLAKVGCLDLLANLSDELLLPEVVVSEIIAGPPADPARRMLEAGWAGVMPSTTIPTELLEWSLGPGETAVLALAQQRAPATAVLDDAAARVCANVIGVPVIGTLGVVLRAKKRGLLESAAETMKALTRAGLRLDAEVIRSALEHVGEVWE